ncbi:DUF6069 family protein [Nonomuraea basaltis]|uniref:DUF6069 family protein n=1 Tax=Nonomuraea basaltis TaxID=2495887 RepID=UPI00110C5B0A|nr:DUF6069 family protein [Nonomuraea basaltis]TMR98330.1 hypothetical protein EJK15_13355 [Nonomuraea basaltis]
MSYPSHDGYDRRPRSARPTVKPARVWGGGVAAAVVAALIVVVGVMISKRILGIRVLTPDGASAYGSAATTGYAISAAAAALVATLLLYILMVSTPEPAKFFGWIAGLFTVLITILPFMHSADLIEQIATAAINLIIGIAILSLLASIGRTALEEVPDPQPYPYEQPGGYDARGYEQRGYERPREHEQRGYQRRDYGPYD